jgi:hypothetical protein
METKKELTVADFINLSTIYRTVDYNIGMLSDSIVGEYADDIKQDLQDIYELVVSAVTLKRNGKQLKRWDFAISDCDISMSYQTAKSISDKLDYFNKKANERLHLYDYYGRTIAENLNEPELDLAVDGLLSALF